MRSRERERESKLTVEKKRQRFKFVRREESKLTRGNRSTVKVNP